MNKIILGIISLCVSFSVLADSGKGNSKNKVFKEPSEYSRNEPHGYYGNNYNQNHPHWNPNASPRAHQNKYGRDHYDNKNYYGNRGYYERRDEIVVSPNSITVPGITIMK